MQSAGHLMAALQTEQLDVIIYKSRRTVRQLGERIVMPLFPQRVGIEKGHDALLNLGIETGGLTQQRQQPERRAQAQTPSRIVAVQPVRNPPPNF